jgi:hypothetical protein
MPTLFLLNLFDEAKDARYNGSFKSVWFANAATRPAGMNLGDTALFCTKFEIPDATEATKKYKTFDLSKVYNANGTPKDKFRYVCINKFDDPTRPSVPEEQSARDVFVIRLAEMYLIAAEAEFKLNNLVKAASLINSIRTRAALPGQTAAMQIVPANLSIDFILDERARELSAEQLRWFDLKRTNKLIERIKLYNPEAAPNVKDFHILRPIPQRQIDAVINKSQFTQNPGYQ